MFVEVLIQTIGFIAIAVNILAMQYNSHAKIVIMRTLGSFLFGIQYLLLSAYAGVVMELIGWIRNITFIFLVKKGKSTKPWIVFFSLITVASGVSTILLTWNYSINGIRWTDSIPLATALLVGISVLSIVAKVLSTVAYGVKNPRSIRMLNLFTSPCWLVYNLVAFSIAGVANEIMTICSIIVAEKRFSNNNTKSADNLPTDVIDQPTQNVIATTEKTEKLVTNRPLE